MVMKVCLWLIIIVLYAKLFTCAYRIMVTRKGLSEATCCCSDGTKTRILLLLPVLREQNVILKTLTHFTNLKTENSDILVCIAGTSREKSQRPDRETTGEIVSRWINDNSCACTFRYAEINEQEGDRASQLNYAVKDNEDFRPDIIGVYDADSLPDSETLNEISARWQKTKSTVFQQPVHFVDAANRMAHEGANPILTANALYQTTWTVIREYPVWYQHHRFCMEKNGGGFFPRNDYLIGHGEFIPYSVYRSYHFPEQEITDGIQLGYRLSMSGADICPLNTFCSDDVPQSFGQLIGQHKRWFGGCNRLIESYKWCLNNCGIASFAQVIDGFFSQASWAFAGTLHFMGLLLAVFSALNGGLLPALLEVLGILAYCYAVPYAAHKVIPVKIHVRLIDWLCLPLAIFTKGIGPNVYFFQRITSIFTKRRIRYSKVER